MLTWRARSPSCELEFGERRLVGLYGWVNFGPILSFRHSAVGGRRMRGGLGCSEDVALSWEYFVRQADGDWFVTATGERTAAGLRCPDGRTGSCPDKESFFGFGI